MEENRLEVRCCCNPSRLYGWLTVTNPRVRSPISYPMMEIDHVDQIILTPEYVTFPVPLAERFVRNGPGPARKEYLALRYDDESIPPEQKFERLKLIPGFEPNPSFEEQRYKDT